MPCAGRESAAKCRVRASGLLSEPDETEIKKLTRAEVKTASALPVVPGCWENVRCP